MTKDEILAEFERFIEFTTGSDKNHVTTTSTLIFSEHIAALATQSERESRQAAQSENEQLKARLARSGVELRSAVREAHKSHEWQPIETAPKDDTIVDLWRVRFGFGERLPNMRMVTLSPDNSFYEPVECGPSCVRDATHWRLPPGEPGGLK